jgi:hypothetical protein
MITPGMDNSDTSLKLKRDAYMVNLRRNNLSKHIASKRMPYSQYQCQPDNQNEDPLFSKKMTAMRRRAAQVIEKVMLVSDIWLVKNDIFEIVTTIGSDEEFFKSLGETQFIGRAVGFLEELSIESNEMKLEYRETAIEFLLWILSNTLIYSHNTDKLIEPATLAFIIKIFMDHERTFILSNCLHYLANTIGECSKFFDNGTDIRNFIEENIAEIFPKANIMLYKLLTQVPPDEFLIEAILFFYSNIIRFTKKKLVYVEVS